MSGRTESAIIDLLENRDGSTDTRVTAGDQGLLPLELAGGLVLCAIGEDVVQRRRLELGLLAREVLLLLLGDRRGEESRSVLFGDGAGRGHGALVGWVGGLGWWVGLVG